MRQQRDAVARARCLIVALVALQVALTAQGRPGTPFNPLEYDSLWGFHVAAEDYAAARRIIAGGLPGADAVAAHFTVGDSRGAVRAASALLTAPPAELTRALNLIVQSRNDINGDRTISRTELAAFVAEARQRVDSLSREDGAEAAVAMNSLEHRLDLGNETAHQQRVSALLARYAGTAAAAEFEVGQVEGTQFEKDPEAKLGRLRAAANKHDRTCAGAKAFYLLGWRIGNPAISGNDATERLLRVFEIVKELESGRFPPCRWVDQASELIFDSYYGTDAYHAPADYSRVYQGYLQFVLTHRQRRGRHASEGFGAMLQRISRLGQSAAERRATIERFYADLVLNGYGAEEAQLFRATYGLVSFGPDDPLVKDPAEPIREARRLLGRLIETGRPDTIARALATAAALDLSRRDYADARASYALLASQFAATEWAWVAEFRRAQATEALSEPQALSMYESLASGSRLPVSGVVLARIAAGEMRESSNAYTDAAAHYRAAITAWRDLPDPISIRTGNLDEKPAFARFNNISIADLSKRIVRLSRLTSTSETLLYEGRRAYESQRPGDAILPLTTLLESYPKSSAASEGRILLRRAQLAEILSRRQQDLARIDRELELLSAGAYDSVTTPSKLARAAFKLRSSGRAEAEAMTTQALEEWHARQSLVPDRDTPLARDIAAIRAEVFRPRVSAAAATLLQAIAPFAIVPKEIQVKIGEAKEERMSVPFAATPDTRVLFATSEELDLMRMILARVRTDGPPSPEVRVWTRPDTVASHWSKMFSMQTDSLSRWTLTAYPAVGRITFDRDNHALVDFSSSGDRGGTIEFEKEDGIWIAKRIVSTWIA